MQPTRCGQGKQQGPPTRAAFASMLICNVMRKWIIAIATVVVLACICWWFFSGSSGKASNIVDFHPESFTASARVPLFYSVGKTLKYGDVITSGGPKLFDVQSWIKNPLVSPDNTMLAFVDDSALFIVGHDGATRKVTPVDTIYRGIGGEPAKPLGRVFFRDQDFQWASDSRALYLIRDQYYESVGSQLYSKHGELWKYDLDIGSLQLVLKPFEAYQFFFGMHGIYFSVPTPQGDLQLLYFDWKQTVDIGTPNELFSEDMLHPGKREQIFYTFDTVLDAERFSGALRVDTKIDDALRVERWTVNGHEFLTVTEGEGFKGSYYCGSSEKTRYLPGNEFAFIDLAGCGIFDGQLLLNLSTRHYSTLPKNTRVYLVLNTNNAKNYTLSGGGINLH